MNGADGISDIEGKATRVGASERGQRTSFNPLARTAAVSSGRGRSLYVLNSAKERSSHGALRLPGTWAKPLRPQLSTNYHRLPSINQSEQKRDSQHLTLNYELCPICD